MHAGQYVEYNPVKAGLVKESGDWKYRSSRYYPLGINDPVVDGYQTKKFPILPVGINLWDENVFENQSTIVSHFFRFQF